MIKITKVGTTPQVPIPHGGKCYRCGCEFTYEDEDLYSTGLMQGGTINCPWCHSYIYVYPSTTWHCNTTYPETYYSTKNESEVTCSECSNCI